MLFVRPSSLESSLLATGEQCGPVIRVTSTGPLLPLLTAGIHLENSSLMMVPFALLGLLERDASYGYELKREYDSHLGRGKPLPFGQVYATLSRLARDGLVSVGAPERGGGPDRKRYTITEDGSAEFDAWLGEAVEPEPHLQTVLFVKVVLALLVGRSAQGYLDCQRASHLARMRQLTTAKASASLLDGLLADHALFRLEADLRWIDLTEARLDGLARELLA